jgi:protein-disulfide isomerase
MRLLTVAAALLVAAGAAATSACGQPRSAETAAAAAPRVDPDSVRARADRGRVKGEPDAPIGIVEISDFQCPFCAEFARTTYRQVDSAYVRTGRARMIYVHLPLANHAEAFPAAEASMCASAQGKFWEMHDRIFAAQRDWARAADAMQRFERMARDAGVDVAAWRECMTNRRTAALVVGDALQAATAGINGTPTFILTAGGSQRALQGAVPFEQFAEAIEALVAEAPAAPGPASGGGAPPAGAERRP